MELTAQSDALRLANGSRVRVTRSEDIDEFEGGHTVVHIRYRFESPSCTEAAETTLELSMGGSP